MPKIDIVIPIFNQADKIIDCLESIEKQTFGDYSITIVDDGSTDNVEKKLRQFNLRKKKKHGDDSTSTKNFVLIKQENKGANAARNRGADQGNAPFLLFCDADVIMKHHMLEDMYHVLEKYPERSYAYSSFKYGFKTFRLWPFDETRLKKMPYIHTTSLMRRKDFGGFDENIKRLQDWDLFLTMLENGKKGVWVREILFSIKPGGTMSSWIPKFFIKHFPTNKKVRAYNNAVEIIKKKHGLL